MFLRTGESRGFAFVRYKYADEASKAVDRLDGMLLLFVFIGSSYALFGLNTLLAAYAIALMYKLFFCDKR